MKRFFRRFIVDQKFIIAIDHNKDVFSCCFWGGLFSFFLDVDVGGVTSSITQVASLLGLERDEDIAVRFISA